jgi:hypothetical protein
MGYSISRAAWEKLEKRRRDGELCQGPARSCTNRALVVVTQETWTYKIGEGQSHTGELRMCKRHAAEFPVGFQGVNFKVLEVSHG